jgi:hypothetical protein
MTIVESLIILSYIDQGMERSRFFKTVVAHFPPSFGNSYPYRAFQVTIFDQVPTEHLHLITITVESSIISRYIDQEPERSGSFGTETVTFNLCIRKVTPEIALGATT